MATRNSLKRRASEDISSDSFNTTPPKKNKANPRAKTTRSVPRTSQRARKPVVKREKSGVSEGASFKSHLVPRGTRKTAKVGQRDESLLRMLCDDSVSGEAKELHFRNIPHSSIDWNDVEHINKINNWRNQIYGRAGMKSKAVILWLPDEELWFELYFQLSIAESLTRGMILPKTIDILQAFNNTFAGRVIQDHYGKDTKPRAERRSNAFASKINRMCQRLRDRLSQCVFGTSGDAFVPKVTMKMLQTYKQMKLDMKEKGVMEESEYSDNLEEWRYLFSHLPDATDIKMQDVPTSTVEEDVAAVLLTLQNPVHHQKPVETAKKDLSAELWALYHEADQLYTGAHEDTEHSALHALAQSTTTSNTPPQTTRDNVWYATPELSQPSSSFLSSRQSHRPFTPPRRVSFGNEYGDVFAQAAPSVRRCASPMQAVDIFALIASPD